MSAVLRDAIRLVAEHGDDFWTAVHLTVHGGGVVILSPECVCIAQRESPDTLFLWLVMGEDYLPKLCTMAPPGIVWLKWQRGFRLAERAKVGVFPFHRVQRLVHLSRHSP